MTSLPGVRDTDKCTWAIYNDKCTSAIYNGKCTSAIYNDKCTSAIYNGICNWLGSDVLTGHVRLDNTDETCWKLWENVVRHNHIIFLYL